MALHFRKAAQPTGRMWDSAHPPRKRFPARRARATAGSRPGNNLPNRKPCDPASLAENRWRADAISLCWEKPAHDVIDLKDARLARIVKRCRDLPSRKLFEYLDEDSVRVIASGDVNDYLAEITGQDFNAKVLRTLAGTTMAAIDLSCARNGRSVRPTKCTELRLLTLLTVLRISACGGPCRRFF